MPDYAPSQAEPRIYVASLADYNAGYLHGTWIDATADLVDIHAMVGQILIAGHHPDAEEWAIHDYEGFYGIRLSEWEPLERVAQLGAGIAEHGEAFARWVEHCEPADDELDGFEDAYLGRWDSIADYARSLLEDFGEDVEDVGPEHLRSYFSFDFDAYARDVASESSIAQGSDGVYVFSC